jgi:hypothetical protein
MVTKDVRKEEAVKEKLDINTKMMYTSMILS